MSSYTNDSVTAYFNSMDLSDRGQASSKVHDELVKNISGHQFQFGLKSGTANVFILKISGPTVNVDLSRNI